MKRNGTTNTVLMYNSDARAAKQTNKPTPAACTTCTYRGVAFQILNTKRLTTDSQNRYCHACFARRS